MKSKNLVISKSRLNITKILWNFKSNIKKNIYIEIHKARNLKIIFEIDGIYLYIHTNTYNRNTFNYLISKDKVISNLKIKRSSIQSLKDYKLYALA